MKNYASHTDEFRETGRLPLKRTLVKFPRVGEPPVNMECNLGQLLELGAPPTGSADDIAETLPFHVSDTKARTNGESRALLDHPGRWETISGMVAECLIAKQIQLRSKMKGGTGMFGSGDRWLRKRRMFRPALSVLLMGMVMLGFNPVTQAAEKGPIRIGFIAPITGNWAQLGTDMVDGFKMFLDEINYTVAGRKIEFIVEDETANPAAAVTKARKLITHNQVHLIAGIFIVSSAYATAPICIEAKIPLIGTVCTADDLTQRKASKYFIRLSYTSSVNGHVAGDYAFKKLGWRRAIVVGMDYAWGYEVGGGFQQVFEDAGGKIVQKVWTPMNTLDFGPYITDLKRDADGIIDVITGAQTVRFIKGLAGQRTQMAGHRSGSHHG